jgi:AcrR family transcriptional regulator
MPPREAAIAKRVEPARKRQQRAGQGVAGVDIRSQIKKVATDLLIRNGYHGFGFQQISDKLNVSRANVHYHFGSKRALVEEVVVDYTNVTLDAFHAVWANEETTLQEKIRQSMQLNLKRYTSFNVTGRTGNSWSLIARMRLDRELLSKNARKALAEFGSKLEQYMHEGVEIARRKGELRDDAPVDRIALLLVSIANSAGPITQDAGSFDRLEQLYLSFGQLLEHAYGAEPPRQRPRPSRRGA